MLSRLSTHQRAVEPVLAYTCTRLPGLCLVSPHCNTIKQPLRSDSDLRLHGGLKNTFTNRPQSHSVQYVARNYIVPGLYLVSPHCNTKQPPRSELHGGLKKTFTNQLSDLLNETFLHHKKRRITPDVIIIIIIIMTFIGRKLRQRSKCAKSVVACTD